jgi:outer membrane usher protein
MFTARNGRFGAQGLRAGRWRIEMPTEPPTIYEIEVRDDPSGTVRLGDVRPLEQGKGE